MAATASTTIRELPRDSRSPTPEPLPLRILELLVIVPVVSFLCLNSALSWQNLQPELPDLVGWLILVAVVDLMPVPVWGTVQITMSFPILLAAAMIFQPIAVGLVAFIGTTDLREFRREVPLAHGLYNRSQIALSVMGASLLFHVLDGDVGRWPFVLAVATPALILDFLVNTALVMLATLLLTQLPLGRVLRNSYGGAPVQFILTYFCSGLVAVVLASTFETSGSWGLIAFLVPVLLARQMFAHGQRLSEASKAVAEKTQMLLSLSERIAEERRDERLTLAAGLHDEVLPPLYQVHLMGQVLRQDLASGKLLELDDDLPELVRATDHANRAARILIRELRLSSIGPQSLTKTLRLLVRELSEQSEASIKIEMDDVNGSPLVQLLAYQIAREALRNAVRHSNATSILLRLSREESHIRLLVEDDGSGFSVHAVDAEGHFGLQLMRERVELAGGDFQVISTPGSGTRVVARLPTETRPPQT